MKKLDIYIIKKFLGTFLFSLLIILLIAVIFDLSEKIDDFMESHAPVRAVIFDYYFNFIPYFAVLFSSLFTFISVIFFTSKMAYNTEIIAILSTGISFRRMLVPYFISAFIIASWAFVMTNYVIPPANKVRLAFEEVYIHNRPPRYSDRNIHKQVRPGIFIYMESYSNTSNIGYKFSMEKFEDGKLVSKMMADYIRWDSTENKWDARNYYIRDINGLDESISSGRSIDTTLYIYPADFRRRLNVVETMNMKQLNAFIAQQKMQGADNVSEFEIEKYKRIAFPFSTFILTLIGVAVSSRKAKGGIGVHIGTGLALSFSYILFMQFSSQFSISGAINPVLAVWIPNILYAIIAGFLYRLVPK